MQDLDILCRVIPDDLVEFCKLAGLEEHLGLPELELLLAQTQSLRTAILCLREVDIKKEKKKERIIQKMEKDKEIVSERERVKEIVIEIYAKLHFACDRKKEREETENKKRKR